MYKKLILILIIFIISFSIYADERKENIDIYILLDKSLSMENNIEEVKKYLNTHIIDNIIINGDRLLIINFYGKTELFIDRRIENADIKTELKSRLSNILADGRFTDIGNALDKLTDTAGLDQERLKYMLLITDGKQEAPPGTRYYSEDGSFNHEMLKHTKTIQKKGWKIEVLGIGKLNKAADIAEKLSGTYIDVDKADAKELSEKTADFLKIFSVKDKPVMKKFNRENESVLTFQAIASNADEKTEIVIDSIIFTTEKNAYEMVHHPFSFYMDPDNITEIEIPVKINNSLASGNYKGTIEFFYSSENILTPSLFETDLEKSKSMNPIIIYLIPALIVLILLFLFVKRFFSGNKNNEDGGFDIFLDNEKLSEIPLILKNNEKLFILISKTGDFSLSRIKSAFAKAYIIKNGNMIDFKIIDNKFFPDFKDKIDNILGKSVNIKMNSGKLLKLLFKRK